MKTRQQAITYGLTFPHTYVESPFKDPNWELVRVKGSKKAFLWVYEKDGYINLNIKVDPEWREFWREAYDAVIPGYHQNKKYWNTIILDGTIPEKDIKKMIKESYDQALQMLRENRDLMDKLAAFLIERETITGKEFMIIFRAVEKGLEVSDVLDAEGLKALDEAVKAEDKTDEANVDTETAESTVQAPAEMPAESSGDSEDH